MLESDSQVATTDAVVVDDHGFIREGETGRFVAGHSVGRPKGSRNKLGEAFVSDLYEHWQEHGVEVIKAAARDKPADYLKVIASILPKDIKVSLETMNDSELSRRIDQLTQSLGLKLEPTIVDVTPEDKTGS